MALYHRTIDVTDNSGTKLTDYQTKVTFGSGDPIFTNGSSTGLRFRDGSGTLLDHYIESFDSTNETAEIWVKVPSVPASGTTTIHLFYGDGKNVKASDGTATFLAFDAFNDGTVDSKWNFNNTTYSESGGHLSIGSDTTSTQVAGPTIPDEDVTVEMAYYLYGGGSGEMGIGNGYPSGAGGRGEIYATQNYAGEDWSIKTEDSGEVAGTGGTSRTTDIKEWNELRLQVDPSDTTAYLRAEPESSDTVTLNGSYSVTWNDHRIGFHTYKTKMDVDWIRAREYASSEPSVAVSTEVNPKPTSPGSTVNGDDSIDFSWTDNWGYESQFRVQINRDGIGWKNPNGGPATPGANDTLVTYTPNSDQAYSTVVGMDSSFQFRVRAEGLNEVTPWVTASAVYTTPTPPQKPSASRPDSKTVELSWTVQSDIAEGSRVFIREDTGSGYGSWSLMDTLSGGEAHLVSGTPGSKGSTVTVQYKADTSYQNTATFTTDSRVQFRVTQDNFSASVTSDVVYADYGNNGNVYFHDDFSSGDTSNWTSLNVSDTDADVGVNAGTTPTLNPSGTDIQPVTAGYQCNLDAGSSLVKNLGDLSGENDVYVRVRFAVSSMDSSGEDASPIEWYDGSAWNTLKTLGSEANRQGYVDLHATVPSTLLSTDNRLRVRGYGYVGDHAEVDEVIVSDILHEYTTPAAHTSQTLDNSIEDELTVDATDNAAFNDGYNISIKKSSSTTYSNAKTGTGYRLNFPSTITNLDDGEKYDVRTRIMIDQYRHGTRSSTWYPSSITSTAVTLLPSPSSVSIEIDGDSYTLSWVNNDDNGAPHVYVSTDGGSTWTDDSGALTATATTYTTSALSSADTHTLKVQVETPHTTAASPNLTEVLAGSTARRESGGTKANESGVVMTE